MNTMRLLSLNIRYGVADDGDNSWKNRASSLCELLQKSQADIIVLQEALNFQLDYIQYYLGNWARIGVGRDDGCGQGEHCPVLFSPKNWECINNDTFWLSKTPGIPGSKSWNASLPRIFTWAKMRNKKSKEEILICNTHWDHISSAARKNSAVCICDFLSQHNTIPVILCGDFNENLNSKGLLQLYQYSDILKPAWHLNFPNTVMPNTYHDFTGIGNLSIDHMFVNKYILVHHMFIDSRQYQSRWPSDHFALVMDFSVTNLNADTL